MRHESVSHALALSKRKDARMPLHEIHRHTNMEDAIACRCGRCPWRKRQLIEIRRRRRMRQLERESLMRLHAPE